jgi:hypothetical protein
VPAIVDAFSYGGLGPRPFTAEPDNFLKDNFVQSVECVSAVQEGLIQLAQADPCKAQVAFQQKVLAGLKDSKVGRYSHQHDTAIYRYGYDHPSTIRLAYMFV